MSNCEAFAGSYQSAKSAYDEGNYNGAIAILDSIANKHGVSAELMYDLGNAYAKTGDYGNAMLSYLKAQNLNPSDKNIKNNIRYIQNKVQDNNIAELKGKKVSLDVDTPSFFGNIKNKINKNYSSDTWAIWSIVSFIIFCGAVAAYLFVNNVLIRKIGFFAGIGFITISIVTLVFAFSSAEAHVNTDMGVITAQKCKLHVDADATSKENQFALTRGTVMTILDIHPSEGNDPRWYKVRLNSDFIGWISAEDFKPVKSDN